jgi:hypothetical protein
MKTRRPPPSPPPKIEEKDFIWRYHKPGFQINQIGQLRTAPLNDTVLPADPKAP